MSSERRRSLEIPTDDEGRLGRECPRCHGRFKIELEHYQDRGFMNLRCPYCRFIAELDRFTTGEQRQYMHASLQNMGLRAMEEIIEEEFSELSGFSNDFIEFEMDMDSPDVGRTPTDPPTLSTETEGTICETCQFPYNVERGQDGVCPVCR